MDNTPIFRPPTPPKAGIFFCTIFFLTINLGAKNESKVSASQSSFVLYYQPLHEFGHQKSGEYISRLRLLLSHPEAASLSNEVLESQSQKKCNRKTSRGPCSQVLYGTNACVPKKEKPGTYCIKKSRKLKTGYFKEPLFNRIRWNRLSLKLNKYCNFNSNKHCQRLAQLHDEFMNSYKSLIKEKKEKRQKMRK